MLESSEVQLTSAERRQRVMDSIENRGGAVTVGDVVRDTGLELDAVECQLERLLAEFKSHVDVDEEGRLRYRFESGFQARGEHESLWAKMKHKLWTASKAVFKVWTMVMLVGYTVVFVLLLIALSIAMMGAMLAGADDGDGLEVGILPFYLVGELLEAIFWINIFSGSGWRSRGPKRRRGCLKKLQFAKSDEPLYEQIFRFLFGPSTDESDPLQSQKEFTRFVRSRAGVVTPAEWSSRSGRGLDESDNSLTGGTVRFHGDVEVSEHGEVVYRFDKLMETADSSEERTFGRVPPFWQRDVSLPEFSGNHKSRDVLFSVFNSFNLVMALGVLGLAGGTLGAWGTVFLGWLPAVFSLCFFAFPAGRWLYRQFKKREVNRKRVWQRIVRRVFDASASEDPEPVPVEEVGEANVDRLIRAFDAQIEVGEQGKKYLKFPTISNQYRAAVEARKESKKFEFDETVFSSDDEEMTLEEAELEEFDRRLARELDPAV